MKAIYGDRPTVPYWLLGAYVGPTRQARSAAGGALMTVAALRTELQRLGYEYLKDAVDHISRILSEHSLVHICTFKKGKRGKGNLLQVVRNLRERPRGINDPLERKFERK